MAPRKDIDEEEDMTDHEKRNCKDLAKQFVENQQAGLIDVALGGGIIHFCARENKTNKRNCYREDGNDYTELFTNDTSIEYMEERDDLLKLTAKGTKSKSLILL